MKPVFETERGALFLGDGVAWLEACEPETVDLVIADPPYGLGKSSWDRFPDLNTYLDWTRTWVNAAHAALKPEGTLYVMGFSETLAEVKVAVSRKWYSTRWLVWYYRNKANLRDDWGRSHESVLVLRKSKQFVFNTDEVRVPYNAHTVRYPARTQAETSQFGGAKAKGRGWTPHPLGARPRDVLEIPVLANGTKEKTKHPTQKPVQLIRKLLLASSNTGDLVVDPFCGSGTTAVVAETHERRWRTCERDAAYAELASTRLANLEAHQGAQTRDSESVLATRRGKLRSGKDGQ